MRLIQRVGEKGMRRRYELLRQSEWFQKDTRETMSFGTNRSY